MLDIEIVEASNKSEELTKAYIKKQFEITDMQDKLKSIFMRQNKDTYMENMEIVKELINATIERTFHEGQAFGKETIVYKEKEDAGFQPTREQVYSQRSDHYTGD